MRKLIEKYRRSPDWDSDRLTMVRLGNGEEWGLMRPWVQVVPHFEGGVAVDRSKLLTCDELDPLIEAIGAEEDAAKQILLTMTLGALLLQRSYDLTDDELSRLFTYRIGDPASEEMIATVIDVATGGLGRAVGPGAIADPKAPGDGCA